MKKRPPAPVVPPAEPDQDHGAIVVRLVAAGVGKAVAVQYTDAFIEYREASKNIRDQGAMVLHPRTSNPIENPYLQIRDRALRKLQTMRGISAAAAWLW